MKNTKFRKAALLLALLLTVGSFAPAAYAEETTDDPAVEAVIAQLEAIDTLQEMQNKRNTYTAKSHYDINTTDPAIIEAHTAARTQYETYISEMFAARIAAQQAYDSLTGSQKAAIPLELSSKLGGELSTVFNTQTLPVTPSYDEYAFEAVKGGAGYGYEIGNYMVSGNIPQTFILVDTSDGSTSWTPNGEYVCGESNYEVTYCCDIMTPLAYTTHYKRLNLEDSNYYGEASAGHIRAILQNSYPYVSMDEMKANLKAAGMDAELVDELNRADLISAVQMAIWTYANVNDNTGSLGYFASVDIPKNIGIYFTPLHDYTSELWEWLPGKRQRSFDSRAEYRVNTLAYYLCTLPEESPSDEEIIISEIEVIRADLISLEDKTFNVGMYIQLNQSGDSDDELKVEIKSYDEEGNVTGHSNQPVNAGVSELQMTVKANIGDTVQVVLSGTQYVERGVYFYEPEGGRDTSQSLVGVSEGNTPVRAEKSFVFTENAGEMGLRIYKTVGGTGKPISDITFSVYRVDLADGELLNPVPTAEEIALYVKEQNKAVSVVTDITGYASAELEEGIYIIVEEHNAEKIVAPIEPFYITIPMTESVEHEDGTVTVETVNIVSIYPKNEPTKPPEEPPVIPPTPDRVVGRFEILKHDEFDRSIVLEGAEFVVYKAATEEDTEVELIVCEGIQYAVVPVLVDGSHLTLITDENGRASSPELKCGTYFLVEVDSPVGYNLLDEAVSVTVIPNAMESVALAEIPNRRGTFLPETGAAGTKWLIIIGSAVTLSAAVLLVTRKRMSIYE